MELVFIHGWGFTADFWNPVCALLPEFPQRRVDMGFYGNPSTPETFGDDAILIGHSLGFMHGLGQSQKWQAWIAINSFARFLREPGKIGCVDPGDLRMMEMGMMFAGAKVLSTFYGRVGAKSPASTPDMERLSSALEELHDDRTSTLQSLNAPGLVLASRNDPLVPVETSEALGAMAQGGVKWHETGGHILPLNDPAWCAEAIRDFVQNLPDRR